MFGLPPRFPISQDIGKAMAKGIKKSVYPASRMITREQIETDRVRRGEDRQQSAPGPKHISEKPGILSRLRDLFFSR